MKIKELVKAALGVSNYVICDEDGNLIYEGKRTGMKMSDFRGMTVDSFQVTRNTIVISVEREEE